MPIYTNQHNLPEPLANAVKREYYVREGHISVTGLIQPPQKALLEQQHDAEIVIDVADEVYALLGSSVHSVLERAEADNALQEERLSMDIDGWMVTGKPDLLEADGTLSDYKVCSVFSFLLGDKPEWETQLNCYAALYRHAGFAVKRLQIVAILRDWRRSRIPDDDYPAAPALAVDIPLWPYEKTYRYLQERVLLHKKARMVGEFPECTPEERWERPDTWAVKKEGNKKALKVCLSQLEAEQYAYDTESYSPTKYACLKSASDRAIKLFETFEEAELFQRTYELQKGVRLIIDKRPGLKCEIEYRPGESVRCTDYCHAAPWCRQWAAIQSRKEKKEAA